MTGPGPDEGWRRLDRRMLLIHPVTEVVRAFPALIGALFAGASNGTGGWWALAVAGLVALASLTRWFTTRLRVGHGQVQLRHGLLRRRTLTANLERVRTVDVTAHVLHRLLGLAKVSIGTGTSDRKGGGHLVVDGLRLADAHRLRDELLHRTAVAAVGVTDRGTDAARPAVTVEPDRTLLTLEPRWVRYAPFTLSGAVAVATVVAFGWRLISEAHLNPDRVQALRWLVRLVRRSSPTAVALAVLIGVVVVVAVASTIGYLLAFWNFRLTRHPEGTLRVTRGLITTRATSIERRRLHGVELSEPLLLRAVGGARLLAVATGLRVGRGAERGGELLVPPAPVGVVVHVAAEVLATDGSPAASPDPLSAPLTPHGSAASRRRAVRAFAGALLVVGLAALLWTLAGWGWGWTVSIVLLAPARWLARDRFRSLGHALVGGALVTRFGSLARRRCVLAADGIIGWNVRTSLFQRRVGVVTLTATTAAGKQRYRVVDVDTGEAIGFASAVTPGLLDTFLA